MCVICLIKTVHGFREKCLLIAKIFFYLPWHVLIILLVYVQKIMKNIVFFKSEEKTNSLITKHLSKYVYKPWSIV